MRWWKVVGLAGLAGVAASGAVVARSQRRRTSYTADEVRARLHERHAQASSLSHNLPDNPPDDAPDDPVDDPVGRVDE